MPDTGLDHRPPANLGKFQNPDFTAKGEARAFVSLYAPADALVQHRQPVQHHLRQLLHRIEPAQRPPRLSLARRRPLLPGRGRRPAAPVEEIGFTGGEPFLNREFPAMLGEAPGTGLSRAGPDQRDEADAAAQSQSCSIYARDTARSLTIRVSIDHFLPEKHEAVRGRGTWRPMLEGLRWLGADGFDLRVAGRTLWHEPEADVRAGFAAPVRAEGIPIDAHDPASSRAVSGDGRTNDVPEITTRCWSILGVRPEQMMCASSRMVHQAEGRGSAGRRSLHPAALRSAVRARPTTRRAQTTVKLEPPVLRPVLRTRRCLLLGG